MAGLEGRNKTAAIVAGSVLVVGAVGAAVMTGAIPRTTPVVTQQEPTVSKPAPLTSQEPVHKRSVARSQAKTNQIANAQVATPPLPPACANCGVIESIESFTEKGQASGGGAVAGGLLGGILGHQIGKGRGKDLATVAGAVGGAIAGNAIEKNANKVAGYHVGVRMNDGTRQLLTLNSAPAVAVGDRVRIVNGEPVRD